MTRNTETYEYVFGPVPSRRLGFSLGVDVVPFKICSYDCIYCQLGRTTRKTTARDDFARVEDIIQELETKLDRNVRLDFITISGSGEPTLYSKLGELISAIKRMSDKPVAVLTNGSLLWDSSVQESVSKADLVIPSLDAGNESLFQYVNRPCEGLSLEKVAKGLADFSKHYPARVWLEVFLLNGVTSVEGEAENINALIRDVRPEKIQLNTVKRPPAEPFAYPVPMSRMRKLAGCFEGEVEVITDFERPLDDAYFRTVKSEIVNLLKRRPCSLNDICGGLNYNKNLALKYLEELESENRIAMSRLGHSYFYSLRKT